MLRWTNIFQDDFCKVKTIYERTWKSEILKDQTNKMTIGGNEAKRMNIEEIKIQDEEETQQS